MPIGPELIIPFTIGGEPEPTYTFSNRLIAQLEPWMTPDLERWCRAIGAMGFDTALELVEEEGTPGQPGWVPPWGKLFDPDLCPARYLPYLAMYVGVELPITATEYEARAILKEEPGHMRGSRKAICAAIKRILGEGEPFTLQERTNVVPEPDPYYFLVFVPTGKATPELRAAIEAVKPAGVFFTIIEQSGTWLAGNKTWAEVAAGVTWATVTEGQY